MEIDQAFSTPKELASNLSGEVISKIFPISNQGGFRYKGNADNPSLIIIYTTGEDIYWTDQFDPELGIFLYYGDNKTPGKELHDTSSCGNKILRKIFDIASSDDLLIREQLPPVFVFKKVQGRCVRFLGLAVPGIKGKPMKDWLTAVWGCNNDGLRFQNYKAFFTIINTSNGSKANPNKSGINLGWINDIDKGNTINSKYAPIEWLKYVKNKNYQPLICKAEKTVRTKQEQLPVEINHIEMLQYIHDYFIDKDRGYSFEKFANDMTYMMDNSIVDISTTRPYKDGGFDGIGKYKLFRKSDNEILVDFYLQAKCYDINSGLGVSDTARLISRIKDRQFGILFTTSFLAKQAYDEIISDGHPIVLINGKKIIEFIINELEIRSYDSLVKWLNEKY